MIFYVCFLFFIFVSPHGKVGFRLVPKPVFAIYGKNLILLVKSTRFPIYFSGFCFPLRRDNLVVVR